MSQADVDFVLVNAMPVVEPPIAPEMDAQADPATNFELDMSFPSGQPLEQPITDPLGNVEIEAVPSLPGVPSTEELLFDEPSQPSSPARPPELRIVSSPSLDPAMEPITASDPRDGRSRF